MSSRRAQLIACLEKGLHYFSIGQFEEARSYWETALQIDPNNDQAHEFMQYLGGDPSSPAAPAPTPTPVPAPTPPKRARDLSTRHMPSFDPYSVPQPDPFEETPVDLLPPRPLAPPNPFLSHTSPQNIEDLLVPETDEERNQPVKTSIFEGGMLSSGNTREGSEIEDFRAIDQTGNHPLISTAEERKEALVFRSEVSAPSPVGVQSPSLFFEEEDEFEQEFPQEEPLPPLLAQDDFDVAPKTPQAPEPADAKKDTYLTPGSRQDLTTRLLPTLGAPKPQQLMDLAPPMEDEERQDDELPPDLEEIPSKPLGKTAPPLAESPADSPKLSSDQIAQLIEVAGKDNDATMIGNAASQELDGVLGTSQELDLEQELFGGELSPGPQFTPASSASLNSALSISPQPKSNHDATSLDVSQNAALHHAPGRLQTLPPGFQFPQDPNDFLDPQAEADIPDPDMTNIGGYQPADTPLSDQEVMLTPQQDIESAFQHFASTDFLPSAENQPDQTFISQSSQSNTSPQSDELEFTGLPETNDNAGSFGEVVSFDLQGADDPYIEQKQAPTLTFRTGQSPTLSPSQAAGYAPRADAPREATLDMDPYYDDEPSNPYDQPTQGEQNPFDAPTYRSEASHQEPHNPYQQQGHSQDPAATMMEQTSQHNFSYPQEPNPFEDDFQQNTQQTAPPQHTQDYASFSHDQQDPYGADPYNADPYNADPYGAQNNAGSYGSDPYGAQQADADPYGSGHYNTQNNIDPYGNTMGPGDHFPDQAAQQDPYGSGQMPEAHHQTPAHQTNNDDDMSGLIPAKKPQSVLELDAMMEAVEDEFGEDPTPDAPMPSLQERIAYLPSAALRHDDIELDTMLAPTPIEQPPSDENDEVTILLTGARDLLAEEEYRSAMELLESAKNLDPNHPGVLESYEECKEKVEEIYLQEIQSLDLVPKMQCSTEEIMRLNIDARVGFLLSQIDGFTSLNDLLLLTGFSETDLIRVIGQLKDQRVIELT